MKSHDTVDPGMKIQYLDHLQGRRRPGGMPSILLIDVPEDVRLASRFRVYLDTACVHSSSMQPKDFHELAQYSVWVQRTQMAHYIVIDAPREVGLRLGEVLRHQGYPVLTRT